MCVLVLAVGNDVDQQTVDSAASFLFTLFSCDPVLSRSSGEKMKDTLGPFPASAANKACDAVSKIIDIVPECRSMEFSTPKQGEPVDEFGCNIRFSYSNEKVENRNSPQVNGLGRRSGGYDSLSDEEDDSTGTLSGQLLTGIMSKAEAIRREDVPVAAAAVSKPHPAGKYSGEWLKRACQDHVSGGGLNWQDLFRAVFELLSAGGDNSSIENDVSGVLAHLSMDAITCSGCCVQLCSYPIL